MTYLTTLIGLLLFIVNQSDLAALDYDLVYDETQVLAFYITIAPEDWQRMQPQSPSPEQKGQRGLVFPYVPATVKFRDEIYENVGIRFKGSSSYQLAPDPHKKPFKLDFDRFVDGGHFHGFKKLNFHTNTSDPTMMREKLSYDLFRKGGVPAPRATHTVLYLTIEGQLKNAYLGVYTSVEQIGAGFLRTHFGDSNGAFVKRIGGGDLRYAGEGWARYADQYESKSKLKALDFSALIQFIKLLRGARDPQFHQLCQNE